MSKSYRERFAEKERNFVTKNAQRTGAGYHGKSEKAKRKQAKDKLKKEISSDSNE